MARGLDCCERALELQLATGDRYGQAETLDSLGYAHHRLRHFTSGISALERAIALYREFGDRYSEAYSLVHLGDTFRSSGDFESARDSWREALSILRLLDHPDATSVHAKLEMLAAAEADPTSLSG